MTRELIEAYMSSGSLRTLKLAEAAIVTDPSPLFNDGVKYKRFNDLEFKKHPVASDMFKISSILRKTSLFKDFSRARWAAIEYPNGYGNSVLFGGLFYSDGVNTYEIGVKHGGNLIFSSPLTNDVIGYAPRDEVDLIMIATQRLEPK